jgi:peptidoglycan-associated lipoprotein
MKNKLFVSVIFTCLFTIVSYSQQKYIDEANFYYNSENYCEGAEKCALAYEKIDPKSGKAKKMKGDFAFKTAECYRLTEKFSKAVEWYDRAILLKYQEINPLVYFYNGEMYRAMGDFDPAKVNYTEYLKLVPGDAAAERGIKSVQTAKSFIANRTRYVVKTEAKLNKPENDMSPMMGDRKGTSLFFSSSRPGATGSSTDPRSCESYMDLWVTSIDKKGNYGQPTLIQGENINTIDHEGAMCFDGRFKTMFFTRCPMIKKQNLGCDIWVSEASSKGWGDPKKLALKPDNNDTITVGHPCVSPDGKFLIFVSDMPGGLGGLDLWFTEYDRKNDSWTTPVNMGAEINTSGNELFPTFGLDGSLYFSSDGHLGMGGLDIFKATRVGVENKWVKPTNMGYPINSVSNDFGITEIDERKGYFTSNRKGTDTQGEYTDEIWSYDLPPNLFSLKLLVTESGSKGKRVEGATVKITGSDGSSWQGMTNDLGEVFFERKPNDTRYINENTEYVIEASLFGEGDKGYYPNEGAISTVGVTYDQNFIKEIALLPKRPIRLPEVRYALGKADLLVDNTINSKDSLNFVYELLQEYPGLVIKLTSHTDSRGSAAANKELAQKRAESCVNYLVNEKGVSTNRLEAEGRGEDQPRKIWLVNGVYSVEAPAKDVEGEEITLTEEYINQYQKSDKDLFERLHQYNRRTEGEVVSFEYVSEMQKMESKNKADAEEKELKED